MNKFDLIEIEKKCRNLNIKLHSKDWTGKHRFECRISGMVYSAFTKEEALECIEKILDDRILKGKLFYNDDTERIGLIDSSDLFIIDGLNCGYVLEIKINNVWIKDRIEMDQNGIWYLVKTKIKGKEINGIEAKVEV